MGVDAQLLQATLYRLAGDQNVARHKRACIASHQGEPCSPMLFVGTSRCRDAPVCELRMCTYHIINQGKASTGYNPTFYCHLAFPLLCLDVIYPPFVPIADSPLYASVEPSKQAHRWPCCILFAFRTTSATFTRYRVDVLTRPGRTEEFCSASPATPPRCDRGSGTLTES